MKFNSGKEMYDYLLNGNDLYEPQLGIYVFLYNDDGALCTYNLSKLQAAELNKEVRENGDYWGAYLGRGGKILDDEPDASYRFCDLYYNRNWIDTKEVQFEQPRFVLTSSDEYHTTNTYFATMEAASKCMYKEYETTAIAHGDDPVPFHMQRTVMLITEDEVYHWYIDKIPEVIYTGASKNRQIQKNPNDPYSYLVCSLDEEQYASASYHLFRTMEEARQFCYDKKRYQYLENGRFTEDIIPCEDEKKVRIDFVQDDERCFVVNEISSIKIKAIKDLFLCVRHHAYEGVNFDVREIGTYQACVDRSRKEFYDLLTELENLQIDVNVVSESDRQMILDTGIEFEIWDVVRVDKICK